jgi:hypothetical protein
LSKIRKVIVLGVVLVILASLIYFAPTIISTVQKSVNPTSSSSNPQLGTEIKNFPLQQTSITFTNWITATTLYDAYGFAWDTASEGDTFVVIYYTVRNIGDTEIDIDNLLLTTPPTLKYGDYYAEASFGWEFNYTNTGPQNVTTTLMPNQSETNGYIFYEILLGYQPTELLYPNQNSPSLVINLSG